jgi:hypothetical protein
MKTQEQRAASRAADERGGMLIGPDTLKAPLQVRRPDC